jgi:hypothetical protein
MATSDQPPEGGDTEVQRMRDELRKPAPADPMPAEGETDPGGQTVTGDILPASPEGGDTPTIGERDASADRPDRDSGPVQRVDSEHGRATERPHHGPGDATDRGAQPHPASLAEGGEHGAEGDENTGESKDLAWAVKRLAAFRDDLYHADHSRVRPVVTAYDLQAVEIVLAHLSAPRRAEGDEWEGERCQSCGRPYERVWAATNALWNAVVGGSAGLRCPECFDREARAAGFSPYWAVADGHFLIPENRRAEGDEEPCQPPGAEDTITVWFCAQEPLHAAYVSAASDEEFDYKDCSCGANLVKAPFVPASTLTEARRERDGLIDPGDKLQSAASRLAEWVRGQDAPYEVAMAAIEARSAVEQWTVARSLLAEGSSRDG